MKLDEIWKEIKGFEGLYAVSNLGHVKSLPRICMKMEGRQMKEYLYCGKVLQPFKDAKDYQVVRIYKNGQKYDRKVHRLVAEAFLPNPSGLPQINHKDENKRNNAAANLEWCDANYNMNYGTRPSKTSRPLSQLSKNGSFVASFPSIKIASIRTGICRVNIGAAAHGKRKSAGGYRWQFI